MGSVVGFGAGFVGGLGVDVGSGVGLGSISTCFGYCPCITGTNNAAQHWADPRRNRERLAIVGVEDLLADVRMAAGESKYTQAKLR
jgi:hypothetical protein